MATSDFDWISDPALRYADDGSPLLPTDPRVAAARLRTLESDAAAVDALLDPQHVQHQDRISERKGLHIIASGEAHGIPRPNTYSGPTPPDRAREEKFGRNVASQVDAIMPPSRG